MTDIIKIYILGVGELDGKLVVGTAEMVGTAVVGTGEVVGTAELVGAITVVAGEAEGESEGESEGEGESEAEGEAQEGIVVTAVVGAGVIEESGQLNGARLFSGAYVFPERSITGE